MSTALLRCVWWDTDNVCWLQFTLSTQQTTISSVAVACWLTALGNVHLHAWSSRPLSHHCAPQYSTQCNLYYTMSHEITPEGNTIDKDIMISTTTGTRHRRRPRWWAQLSEWVGFNVPINTLLVILEMSLSSQSLALVLTTLNNQEIQHKDMQNDATQKTALVNMTKYTQKKPRLRVRTDRTWFSHPASMYRPILSTRRPQGASVPEPALGK